MHTKLNLNRPHSRRCGAAMILAMITLIICSTVCLSMFQTMILRQQRCVNRHWKVQSRLIAEAALDRALLQLQKEPDYRGETWTVVAGIPPASDAQEESGTGVAEVNVSPLEGDRFQMTVVARYPKSFPTAARTTLETIVMVDKPEASK